MPHNVRKHYYIKEFSYIKMRITCRIKLKDKRPARMTGSSGCCMHHAAALKRMMMMNGKPEMRERQIHSDRKSDRIA